VCNAVAGNAAAPPATAMNTAQSNKQAALTNRQACSALSTAGIGMPPHGERKLRCQPMTTLAYLQTADLSSLWGRVSNPFDSQGPEQHPQVFSTAQPLNSCIAIRAQIHLRMGCHTTAVLSRRQLPSNHATQLLMQRNEAALGTMVSYMTDPSGANAH